MFRAKSRAMFRAMFLAGAVTLAVAPGLLAGPAAHAQGGCFSRQEQRVAVDQGRAIRLGEALRSIHARGGDELLRAELCQRANGLVYVLTIFSRNGKVTRAIVDARSGAVVKDR